MLHLLNTPPPPPFDATLLFTGGASVSTLLKRNESSISSVDPDDPLADLLDDLLPDEAKPKSKSGILQAKPGTSLSPPSASPVLKPETRER